jgi:hypothetical protein
MQNQKENQRIDGMSFYDMGFNRGLDDARVEISYAIAYRVCFAVVELLIAL